MCMAWCEMPNDMPKLPNQVANWVNIFCMIKSFLMDYVLSKRIVFLHRYMLALFVVAALFVGLVSVVVLVDLWAVVAPTCGCGGQVDRRKQNHEGHRRDLHFYHRLRSIQIPQSRGKFRPPISHLIFAFLSAKLHTVHTQAEMSPGHCSILRSKEFDVWLKSLEQAPAVFDVKLLGIWICSLISFECLSTHESNSQRSVILFILSLSPALKRLEEYLAVARVRGKPRRISRKQRGKHRRPFAMPHKIVGPRLRATALRSEAEELMTSRERHHATSDLHLNYPWWCFKRVLKCIANCFRLLKSKSNFTSTFLALFFCSCQVLFCCM